MEARLKCFVSSVSMTQKLGLVFFAVTFIASLLVGIISYQLSEDIIRRSSIDSAEKAASSVAASVDTFLKAADQSLIGVYADEQVQKALGMSTEDMMLNFDALHGTVFNTVQFARALNDSVIFINIYGTNGFNFKDVYYQQEGPSDFAACKEYYSQLGLSMERARALWLGNERVRIQTSTRNMILIVRYIRDLVSYKILGIMVAGLDEASLSKQYMSAGAQPFIIDADGVIQSHVTKAKLTTVWSAGGISALIQAGKRSGTVTFREEGNSPEMFAAFAKISTSGWYFVSIEDYFSVFRNSFALFRSILLILLADLFLAFWVVRGVSRRMTANVNRLFSAMTAAKNGDLAVRFEIRGQDEINRIGGYLNEMLEQIRENISQRERAEQLHRISEIRLLQSQINPHLLYNTLDSVLYCLETGEFRQAGRVLEAMIRFFKISLSKGEFLIPIERELEHVRSYLAIQRMCREKDIRLHITGDASLLQFRIPKMTFQPIVENSVLHGFEGDVTSGNITVDLQRTDGHIRIILSDDGVGLTARQISRLNEKIVKAYIPDQTDGYGLWNVNQRIRHCFGEGSGIRVAGEFGEYARIIITVEEERGYVQNHDCG